MTDDATFMDGNKTRRSVYTRTLLRKEADGQWRIARCKLYDDPKLKPELGARASLMAESCRCTCPGIRLGSVAQPGSGAWFVAGSRGMAGRSLSGAARVASFLLHSPAAR